MVKCRKLLFNSQFRLFKDLRFNSSVKIGSETSGMEGGIL